MIGFDHNSGSTVSIDGAEIYYEIQGNPDGPVVLVLHGGVGTMADFNVILPDLAGFRVIGLDSRGHGKSTLGQVKLTYAQLEKDVLAVLSHLQVEELSILGFSDGGTVALRLASGSTLKVRDLIIVGATWQNEHSLALQDIFSKITGKSWAAKFPETFQDYQRWNPEPDFHRFVKVVVEMWMDNTDTGHPGESVSRIDAPTLVVRGDQDHLVSLQWCLDLMERIEDSHLHNIPFAGHVTFADQPRAFIACAVPFLAGGLAEQE